MYFVDAHAPIPPRFLIAVTICARKEMDKDEDKKRRSNLRIGWAIGIVVLILYATSLYYGAGQ
jgi:hypothetical protein